MKTLQRSIVKQTIEIYNKFNSHENLNYLLKNQIKIKKYNCWLNFFILFKNILFNEEKEYKSKDWVTR